MLHLSVSELRSKCLRVPTNNQRERGSKVCLLWGGLNKSHHIVPTALLVRVQCNAYSYIQRMKEIQLVTTAHMLSHTKYFSHWHQQGWHFLPTTETYFMTKKRESAFVCWILCLYSDSPETNTRRTGTLFKVPMWWIVTCLLIDLETEPERSHATTKQ